MKCQNCGSETSELLTKCTTCWSFIGFPNVTAASKKEEVDALENRYTQALNSAILKGSLDVVKDFEENVKLSCAVINTDFYMVHHIITEGRALYSTYNNLVKSKIRKPATLEDASKRLVVEAILFPEYANDIIYAALSLDGDGLKSYGECSIVLREIAIKDRASVLEDNSFHFISTHKIQFDSELPLGYRVTWANRHKLAISKLEPKLSSTAKRSDYINILLYDSGSRDKDDFLEVHIYGGFDHNAIEYVRGVSAKHPAEMMARIRSILSKAGKRWIDQ